MPRLFCPVALTPGQMLALPAAAARHAQVLRLQPGAALTLFDGRGGEHAATVQRMGRSEVWVQVGAHDPVEREAARPVHLALGMPANERMDWLVEKATELGAASVQPLATAHGVLRLAGERAQRKAAHWQAIAQAACEQCGRNRVPPVYPVAALDDWLATLPAAAAPDARFVLAPDADAPALAALSRALPDAAPVLMLSGPEGGLATAEQAAARVRGFVAATLGPRVLRAETAPLAALALLAAPC